MSSQPFSDAAEAFRAYLASPHGRLRLRLCRRAVAALIAGRPGLEILDVGAGTGELGAWLAAQGHRVTLLEPSSALLETAPPGPRRALGGVMDLDQIFMNEYFDIVICHHVLEYLPNPEAALGALGRRLAPGGALSLATLGRAQEALRRAVRDHDLAGARAALQGSAVPSLFQVQRRGFDAAGLTDALAAVGLEVTALRGLFVAADYLPEDLLRDPARFEALLDFEWAAGADPALAPVGRYLHAAARRAGGGSPAM